MNSKLKKAVKSTKLLVFLCILFAGNTTIFAQWAGSGTSGDPYLITNTDQLISLQTGVNGGTNYSGKYFKLTSNLDLSGNEWTPIGTSTNPFKGNFDGSGKKITRLYINQLSTNDIGLFGYVNTAKISNLGVSTASGGVNGGTNVGILIGTQSGGTITNCYAMGFVAGTDAVGGLVGQQTGTTPSISQSFAIADVTGGTGGNGTGGLAGIHRGNINNSYACSDVRGVGAVGGLSGTAGSNGVINMCYADGSSISLLSTRLGGLAGNLYQASSSIKNSVVLDKALSGGMFVGRVAGVKHASSVLTNNYASNSMSVKIGTMSKNIVSNSNDLDGETKDIDYLKTRAFYNTAVSWNINSINDNGKIWNIWENRSLPYLQTQSSPVSNVTSSGATLQGVFRPDVAMDSISIYVKSGTEFVFLGTANVNNTSHTWAYNNSLFNQKNIMLYIFSYESGKAWPSYPVIYSLCNLPISFDTVDKTTDVSGIDLQTCIVNLQNAEIGDVQFSRTGGTTFDANIISYPTAYSVDGTQTIYARVSVSSGCQSEIKSFQVKKTGTLLFREDFGGNDVDDPIVSTIPLPEGRTSYTFTSDVSSGANGMHPEKYCIVKSGPGTWDTWFNYSDHTNPSDINKGYFMAIDASTRPGLFYTHQISDLCPGTRLYFSVWIGNLMNRSSDKNGKYYAPSLRFVLTDSETNTELTEYSTGEIGFSNQAAWKQYGFPFTTNSSSVRLDIYSNTRQEAGNDLVLDDIEIYTYAPAIVFSGSTTYCSGDLENVTVKNNDNTDINSNMKINWLFSEDGDMGPDAVWDTIPNLTSSYLNAEIKKTGYLRAVVGPPGIIDAKEFNCCSISDPTYISIIPRDIYWKKDANDNNWNNPDNWVDINNIALNAVPATCTNVHIPGNSQYYPELDSINTIRTINYGNPVCNNITFHFGSEVAQPQYLTYNKAYVQYNFGYYNGNSFMTDGDDRSSAPMNRGRWYALAAPLKKIVSGDFSVGGFPNFWQRGFKSSQDHTGTLNGEWYNPENTLALEVGPRQNYAIGVWAGEYLPGVLGEDDHKDLNDLKGIIEMPYFENTNINAKHRNHSYDNGISKFNYYYYNIPGLPIATNAFDQYTRGDEAYRFIFEDDNNKAQEDFMINVPAGTEIMIGNPFVSSFNFREFYNKNSAVIEDYYRLFDNNNFVTYSLTTGSPIKTLTDNIAPLQAFFIKTKGISMVRLHFPMSASVTKMIETDQIPPIQEVSQLRSSEQVTDNIFRINVSNSLGNSWASIVINDSKPDSDVRQLFIKTNESKSIPQIYTLNLKKEKNVIQYAGGESIEIPVGIICESKDIMKISVSVPEGISFESLMLVDTYLNKSINLSEENTYSFKTEQGTGERFLLRISNLNAPTSIETAKNESTFQIYANNKAMEIHASGEISKVTVTSVQGINFYTWTGINSNKLTKTIQVPAGIYVVEAILKNGETKVQKIIIK